MKILVVMVIMVEIEVVVTLMVYRVSHLSGKIM